MLLRSFRSEIKKLLSKHTVVGLLVTLCLLTPLTALALRVMFSGYSGLGAPLISSAMQSPSELLLVVFCSNNVLCVLLGTLVFTSGYSTMTIYRDFQVFQNRLVALAGKLLAVEAAVCAASLLSSLLGVLILNLGSTDQFSLTEPLDMIVSCVLNSLLITLFSFGVGLVLSKTVSALITTVSILFILPDVVRTILASLNPVALPLVQYLPAHAASVGIQTAIEGSSYSGIDAMTGVFSVLIMSAVLIVAGSSIQKRKDV